MRRGGWRVVRGGGGGLHGRMIEGRGRGPVVDGGGGWQVVSGGGGGLPRTKEGGGLL